MASLSPVVDVLLREFENTPAEAIVTAEGFDEVAEWEWSASPSFPEGVEVTPEGEQITEFRAETQNKREYGFTVTAHGFVEEGGQPVPVSATETYTVQVLQQYDTNRDILQEEVDARR